MKKIVGKSWFKGLVLALLFGLTITGVSVCRPRKLNSANLLSVKDTLSSSRLSYVGAVGTGNTGSSTLVLIDTSGLPGFATSDDNLNLFTGDDLKIGTTNGYTVVDVSSTDKIQIGTGLGANDFQDGDPIIASRSAQHVITFTPVTAIDSGYYRVRIKATAGTQAQSKDGIPDANGFDFKNVTTGHISCPDSATPTIEYSGDTHCPSGYTCILCGYAGVKTLVSKTLNIGTTASNQQPINPAPSSTGKTAGLADTYTFYVDHLNSSYTLIDSTPGKIAVVESVRVTAVVDPTIELTIAGVGSGSTACGSSNTLDVTTTATTVPFGSVSITNFTDAAQKLTVSTNADGGYAVTALASDQLRMILSTGLGTNDIDDTVGNTGDCSHTDYDEWTTTSVKGFGYSLQNVDAAAIPFQYSTSGSGCTGTYCAKQFADNANSEAGQQIFSSTTVADSEDVYVCYRVIVASTQEAGTYTNAITYVASATF